MNVNFLLIETETIFRQFSSFYSRQILFSYTNIFQMLAMECYQVKQDFEVDALVLQARSLSDLESTCHVCSLDFWHDLLFVLLSADSFPTSKHKNLHK